MFCDKDKALGAFNSIESKKGFSYFLLTAMFDNYEQLSQNGFIILSIKWKTKIKELIHDNDVGVVLNMGNIIAMVKDERKHEFLLRIKKQTNSTQKMASVSSDVIELKKEELASIVLSI